MGILKSNRRGIQAVRKRYDAAYGDLGENPWYDPNDEGLCVWAAYQPVDAASLAASLVDLSGNGNNAGDPGGADTPPWNAANGWMPDGVSDYLTTTFVPANDQSQSVLIQVTDTTNNNAWFGATAGAGLAFRLSKGAPNISYYNGGAQAVVPTLAAGNFGIAGNQGYRNGVADGAAIAAWGGASVWPCYIGALNNAGAPAGFIAAYIRAIVIYDCVLTAPQYLAVATAMTVL